MRFVHTADWHLGRLFHSRHLTGDQAVALDGLVPLMEGLGADALVIAGDVFDRAVPPQDAVRLLNRVLASVALDLGVAVVMIAGNHDSADRLGYLSELVRGSGVHVVGRVGGKLLPAELRGRDGTEVRFWPLAYTDPETAREDLCRDDLHTHEEVVAAQLEAIARGTDGGVRDVLVGHAFVSGCAQSESERELTVGGSSAVSPDLFTGFDYVALGHLHSRQAAGSDRIRYSGSLLKYSFGESGQEKSVTVVDLGPNGELAVGEATLPIARDVRRVRGTFDEILALEVDDRLAAAYVEVVLADVEPVPDAAERLRQRFPELLSVRREATEREVFGPAAGSAGMKTRSTAELFAEFFEDVSGRSVSPEQSTELAATLNGLERASREAG
jgi:DNA repair protein SbcD/Mre11